MNIGNTVEAGRSYLLSRVNSGLCLEFDQLRHGPCLAWTTACIGSTLAEFGPVPAEMLEAILGLQWPNGGWSYNQRVAPDADSTLRVLQFFRKVNFRDPSVINRAEEFVLLHQQPDGGIATYLPESIARMGYPVGGWTDSHPCVTALACRVLRNEASRQKAFVYLAARLAQKDARAYWWRTPWYVRYESGCINEDGVNDDPVEIGLALLLKARLGVPDNALTARLSSLQLTDGSFPVSRQFRIPRPNQSLDDLTDQTEVVDDRTRIFSTAAAVVAISRQKALLN